MTRADGSRAIVKREMVSVGYANVQMTELWTSLDGAMVRDNADGSFTVEETGEILRRWQPPS